LSDRHLALKDLVEFGKSIDDLRSSLAAFEWDFKDIPLTMNGSHFRSVIERYMKGELSAQHVEDWANLIEGREDISFRSNNAETLRQILYELANPELTEKLSLRRAGEMIALLNKHAKLGSD
jgi:hypothetical protein